jgi:hypothetical protein
MGDKKNPNGFLKELDLKRVLRCSRVGPIVGVSVAIEAKRP